MSEGYPDYARLSQQGGVQLFSANGVVPQNAFLFQGYVGSWPYVNLYTDIVAGTDSAQIFLNYHSDSTFTTLVTQRLAIRNNPTLAVTQYANMSPWLSFFYEAQAGTNMTWNPLSLYATTGPANQIELASLDVPIFRNTAVVPANGSLLFDITKIQPGAAKMIVTSNAATWHINVDYYDFTSNSYLFYAKIDSSWAGSGGVFDMPMIDAPMQLSLVNGTAANQQIFVTWASM